MHSFDDIKQIWLAQDAHVLPDAQEIIGICKKYRSVRIRNLRLMIAATVLLAGIMLLVVAYGGAKLWTTSVGEILIFLAILLVLYYKVQSLRIVKSHELKTNQEFINHLRTVDDKHRFQRQIIPMGVLIIAYAFFIFEFLIGDPWMLVAGYIALIVFSLGMWFLYRPWANRRFDRKKERLLSQINEL